MQSSRGAIIRRSMQSSRGAIIRRSMQSSRGASIEALTRLGSLCAVDRKGALRQGDSGAYLRSFQRGHARKDGVRDDAVCGMQAASTQMCSRLRVCALFPSREAPGVRQRTQSVRRGECQQSASRLASAPTRRRCELHGLRGRCTRAGPRLRLRGRHLVSAAANRSPTESACSRQRRDRVHADASSGPSSVSTFAASITRAPAPSLQVTGAVQIQQLGVRSLGGLVDIVKNNQAK